MYFDGVIDSGRLNRILYYAYHSILFEDGDYQLELKIDLAGCEFTPAKILRELIYDESVEVRLAVISSDNVPDDVLVVALTDEEEIVRCAAAEKLF